jgi:hypothetical protein
LADETNVLANTLANLLILHEWVLYFMRFNLMQLNHGKCELVGRGADGAPVTDTAGAAAGIAIDGHLLIPLATPACTAALMAICLRNTASY